MSPLVIFAQIIIPITILIAIGFVLDKAFQLDIQTLTRVGFYVLTPAVVFTSIVNSTLTRDDMTLIAEHAASHMLLMGLIGAALFSLRLFREQRTVLSLGAMFYNAGNYGFPLMLLAFGDWAVGVIAIVLLVQTFLMFTVGLFALIGGEVGVRGAVSRFLKLPVLYALLLGSVMRAFDLSLPPQLGMPVERISDAFIALALITLGAQLARVELAGELPSISAITVVRLIVSPLLAAALVLLLGIPQDMGAVLVLGAGLPAAVNIFIMAREFDSEAEFASQMVFWTTVLSAITIPIVLYIINAVS